MSVLVGRQAPDFIASAVLPHGDITDTFRLSEATQGRHALLFFYPLDFTFVCPSELLALENRHHAFKERDVEVITVSIDSQFVHRAWRHTPQEAGGIGEVSYTMVADIHHTICQSYGVVHPEAGVALRAAFLIDQQGVIRSQLVNDLPIGRNIDELLRLADAIQFHESQGEVCPAGWRSGQPGMQATPAGVAHYLKEHRQEL